MSEQANADPALATGGRLRPLILVTNDDGVDSPGLRAAAEAALPLGDVLVAAPVTVQTGMGRSFPRTETQGVITVLQRSLGRTGHAYYAIHGSPAQTVAHAVLEIALRRPDLCISGINDGENLGGTNLVSGTVGAALEAAYLGIPAVAVSLGSDSFGLFQSPYAESAWRVPVGIARRTAAMILSQELPSRLAVLNVNIPSDATLATEVRFTSQSRQSHYECRCPGQRDFTVPFRLPVESAIDLSALEPDSDLQAFVVDRVISITPIGFDLTARDESGRPLQLQWPQ